MARGHECHGRSNPSRELLSPGAAAFARLQVSRAQLALLVTAHQPKGMVLYMLLDWGPTYMPAFHPAAPCQSPPPSARAPTPPHTLPPATHCLPSMARPPAFSTSMAMG